MNEFPFQVAQNCCQIEKAVYKVILSKSRHKQARNNLSCQEVLMSLA